MDLELDARGRIFLATLGPLHQLVATVNLDIKNLKELSRGALVEILQKWLGEVALQK
jgi:hypothetical protein